MNLIEVLEIIFNNLDELRDADFFTEFNEHIEHSSVSYLQPAIEEIIKFHLINGKFPDFNYLLNISGGLIRDNSEGIYSSDLLIKALNLVREEAKIAKAIEALSRKNESEALRILQSSIIKENVEPITGVETVYDEYIRSLDLPPGMKTGIPDVDNIFKAFSKKSITTIVAPPKNGKTTVAVSMLYWNLMNQPLNIIYIILEGATNELKQNLLSAHSKTMGTPISAFRMKSKDLTREEAIILKTIADDFEAKRKGNYALLDPRHFTVITPIEMTRMLRNIKELWAGRLDGVVSDYIQLYKYYRVPGIIDEKAVINFWVRYWHDICIAEDFTKVILSQMNREGENMMYTKNIVTSKALAEANEIERSTARAFAVQSNPIMQQNNSMRLYWIYHRYGPIPAGFSETYADFAHFQVGEQNFGSVRTLENVENLLDNNNLFS